MFFNDSSKHMFVIEKSSTKNLFIFKHFIQKAPNWK